MTTRKCLSSHPSYSGKTGVFFKLKATKWLKIPGHFYVQRQGKKHCCMMLPCFCLGPHSYAHSIPNQVKTCFGGPTIILNGKGFIAGRQKMPTLILKQFSKRGWKHCCCCLCICTGLQWSQKFRWEKGVPLPCSPALFPCCWFHGKCLACSSESRASDKIPRHGKICIKRIHLSMLVQSIFHHLHHLQTNLCSIFKSHISPNMKVLVRKLILIIVLSPPVLYSNLRSDRWETEWMDGWENFSF